MAIFGFLLLIVFVMVFIGYKLSIKKPSALVKAMLPPIIFFLYLFKTVLQVPTLILIFSTFITPFQHDININDSSPGISVTLGFLIFLQFIIAQFYLITSFKDNNPFS